MTSPRISRRAPALLTLAAALAVGVPSALPVAAQKAKPKKDPTPHPRVEMTPPIKETSPVYPAWQAQRRGEDAAAAAMLRLVDPEKLDAEDRRRWRILGQRVAVRTGDADLLKRASALPEASLFANGRLILDAMEYLEHGDLDLCRRTLEMVKDPEYLDERSRRRYLAMWARLAQMEGDDRAERVYLAKLVDYAGNWASPACQECHTNPEKHGDLITTLDMSNWWAGKRFAEVLKKHGDADAVRRAAEARLAKDREDEGALLRIAYARRATGDEAGCEKTLRSLFWAEFPDRPKVEPLDILTFP